MAAYKKDINLFKAAGGERAKSKKMATGKKLAFVAVLLVIVLLGGIAALYYFNNYVFGAQLKALETTGENYTRTAGATHAALEEYWSVKEQQDTAVLIEYQSMLNANFSSDVSTEELQCIRDFLALETTPFTIDNHFDEVVDEVLNQLNLSRYNATGESFADDNYTARFLYGALSYMKTLEPVFSELPLQTTEEDEDYYYWYCYYRGKMFMMLRNTGGDASALATQLQSPADLGCEPFCSLVGAAGSSLASDFAMYTTVTVADGAESYTLIAITCKTIAERFVDSVEDIFSRQTLPSGYSMADYAFSADDGVFSVTFTMEQTAEFRLKDVCDAVAASPFFVSKNDFAYEINDSVGSISRSLRFLVTNQAVEATRDMAESFFDVEDVLEEE